MITASTIQPSSTPLSSSAIGNGPRTNDVSTSTGNTNRAIWALEPIAMATERSSLSRAAKYTATQCSAAFPAIATTMRLTKNGESPMPLEASSMEPTRIYDMKPTAMPAMASQVTQRRTVHGSPPSSSPESMSGLKMSRWVLSEKNRPATEEASSTTDTSADITSRSWPKWRASTVGDGSAPPSESWKVAGSTSATQASSSSVDWVLAASATNV